jgi:hypothetical protein
LTQNLDRCPSETRPPKITGNSRRLMVPEQNKPELSSLLLKVNRNLSQAISTAAWRFHTAKLKSSFNPMSASRQSCPADLARERRAKYGWNLTDL